MALPTIPRCATLQTPQELLTDMVNGWVPLIEITAPTYPAFAYLMFDTDVLFSDDTSRSIQLKFKSMGGEVAGLHTNAQNQIEWREKIRGFSKTTIAANVAASTTVRVVSIQQLQGIGPNTDVIIISTAAPFSTATPGQVLGNVVSVAGSVITLRNSVTVNANDVIIRGHNSRGYCSPILNTYTFLPEGIYTSNPQSLQLSMSFRTDDLNQDRLMYAYGKNVQSYVDELRRENRNGLMREMMHSFRYGRDVPTQNAAGEAPQSRGVLTSIQHAQNCATDGSVFMHNLQACCDGVDDDQTINAFVNILILAQKSGYYKDGLVTIVMNTAQMAELQKMQSGFNQFAGRTILKYDRTNHEGMMNYASLQVMGVSTEFGEIEFVLDQYLDETHPEPFMVLMPKAMMGFYQNKFMGLNENMNVREAVNAGVPTLLLKDISEYTNYLNGGDECFNYVGKLWFYTVMGGIYNGARHTIQNMKNYRSCGTLCGPTGTGVQGQNIAGQISIPSL